jgi:hypothetical protein
MNAFRIKLFAGMGHGSASKVSTAPPFPPPAKRWGGKAAAKRRPGWGVPFCGNRPHPTHRSLRSRCATLPTRSAGEGREAARLRSREGGGNRARAFPISITPPLCSARAKRRSCPRRRAA